MDSSTLWSLSKEIALPFLLAYLQIIERTHVPCDPKDPLQHELVQPPGDVQVEAVPDIQKVEANRRNVFIAKLESGEGGEKLASSIFVSQIKALSLR